MTTIWTHYDVSTFADSADLDAFSRCKATGKSDEECFAVGDNGIGCWGDVTSQTSEHYVALHADDMIARWGSVNASKHRIVELVVAGRSCIARVGDRCGVRGRIDVNPACQLTLHVPPGSLVPGRWRWME